jgi:hypothetical protein
MGHSHSEHVWKEQFTLVHLLSHDLIRNYRWWLNSCRRGMYSYERIITHYYKCLSEGQCDWRYQYKHVERGGSFTTCDTSWETVSGLLRIAMLANVGGLYQFRNFQQESMYNRSDGKTLGVKRSTTDCVESGKRRTDVSVEKLRLRRVKIVYRRLSTHHRPQFLWSSTSLQSFLIKETMSPSFVGATIQFVHLQDIHKTGIWVSCNAGWKMKERLTHTPNVGVEKLEECTKWSFGVCSEWMFRFTEIVQSQFVIIDSLRTT